jgi:hypothetical protein
VKPGDLISVRIAYLMSCRSESIANPLESSGATAGQTETRPHWFIRRKKEPFCSLRLHKNVAAGSRALKVRDNVSSRILRGGVHGTSYPGSRHRKIVAASCKLLWGILGVGSR